MSNFREFILELLYVVPSVLIALMVHEIAHGFMAYKLGDPTAKNFGRLSLNPLRHLDPVGTICMIFFRVGWAKPVPVNSRYFKKPRRDMALTAAAGPIANFLMAFVALLLYRILFKILAGVEITSGFVFNMVTVLITLISTFVSLNIGLGVFNLLPVPPLDGSRIFLTFLPPKAYFGIMKYERYIQLGLLICLYFGLLDIPLSWARMAVLSGMDWLISLIPGL